MRIKWLAKCHTLQADSCPEVLTVMNIAPYRLVLRQPGLKLIMLIGFLARVPATAAGMVTTLHVITALHLDYASAGVAGTKSERLAALIGGGDTWTVA